MRNRTWRGLFFNAHYTLAHAIDEVSDAFNNRSGQRPMDNLNIRLDRARADFDIRHRFVADFNYELPVFKGNKWLGGWTVTGILQKQSGVPFSIFDSTEDPNADGYFTDRAAFIGTHLDQAIIHETSPANGYFDPSQFVGMVTLATSPDFGSGGVAQIQAACGPNNGVIISATRWWCDSRLGRNVLTGPRFFNMDFGLHKKFPVGEGKTLQLQANAFNVFNHPNFGLPVTDLNNTAQVGKSISTVGTPRVIQLAIRFDF